MKCWLGDPDGEGRRFESTAESLESTLQSIPRPDGVGHRIVHGGRLREPALLTPIVRTAIAREAEVAPVHNQMELAAVDAVERVFGADLPQIAVFDSGFHATLEPAAYVYPGPYEWLEHGIRRYGFHGISYRHASRRAAEILGDAARRLIICHLGNGASVAAVRDGKSVDTSMGFTPLEGLMMGTRSGSIDPGIIIYLLRHRGYSAGQLDEILNRQSGLLGVSGISSDMREILKGIAAGNARAKLAFDIYAHRLCREIGAMLAVLGGLDAIVFTGGVGEHVPELRQAVATQFAFLGMKLDAVRNATNEQDIGAAESKVRVLVIPAEEEREIARECAKLLSARALGTA
jgi:acetate kinase